MSNLFENVLEKLSNTTCPKCNGYCMLSGEFINGKIEHVFTCEDCGYGFDYNRLTLLIAVLEKSAGLALGSQDVYLNVVGGIRINEPALDLGAVISVASSFKNTSIAKDVVVMGEVRFNRRS